jgi:hypothetical protein
MQAQLRCVVMPKYGQLRKKVGITAYSDLDSLAWLSFLY